MPQKESLIGIAETAVVCEDCNLQGDIRIGEYSILHPKCILTAKNGSICLGDRNIVEDQAHISIRNAVLHTGSANLFEVGCRIRSKAIGNGNVFEPKSETRKGSVIGNNCIIGSNVIIGENEIVKDDTIIVCIENDGKFRRIVRDMRPSFITTHYRMIQKHIEAYRGDKGTFALSRNHRIKQPILIEDR